MATQRFKMAYWPWLLPVMMIAGAPPWTAGIEIRDGALRLKLGWFWFSATVPLQSIVHARRSANAWFAVGIHTDGMRGWIVNGSPFNMVHLSIEPSAGGRFAGLPVQINNLWLSVENPDGFLHAIAAGGGTAD